MSLCSVCQNSVINAVASLPCHFHQPSPAQPSRHFRWSSFDWAQIRKIKQFSIVPRVPGPRLLSHILLQVVWEHDFSFTFKRKLWRIIWLRKTFSCSCYEVSDWMLSETVCGVQAAGSLVQSGGSRQRGDHYEATSMDNFSSSGELDGYFNLDRQTRISFSLSRHTTGVYVLFSRQESRDAK